MYLKNCPYEFGSRCTMDRCDCEDINEEDYSYYESHTPRIEEGNKK